MPPGVLHSHGTACRSAVFGCGSNRRRSSASGVHVSFFRIDFDDGVVTACPCNGVVRFQNSFLPIDQLHLRLTDGQRFGFRLGFGLGFVRERQRHFVVRVDFRQIAARCTCQRHLRQITRMDEDRQAERCQNQKNCEIYTYLFHACSPYRNGIAGSSKRFFSASAVGSGN